MLAALQYSGAEKALSEFGQKNACMDRDSEGASSPLLSWNQNRERKRDGIWQWYLTGISETFLIGHEMLEAMPEHVGGNVSVGRPLQNETRGSQQRPATRSVLGWASL